MMSMKGRKLSMKQKKIAVVIPAYKVRLHLENVVRKLPEFIDNIIVVDDACPEKSYEVLQNLDIKKIIVINHEVNMGVGGALISGYKKALSLEVDVVIKVDGDGQMDTSYISSLIEPILDGNADYTKGNRFVDFKALRAMPKVRLLGNSALSFMVKASSGYWNVMDPTNGFTAISNKALQDLDLEVINRRYFFESDMLINLNIENAVVKDVSIPAKYDNENSSLSITKTIVEFPPKLFKGLIRRIFFKYYIYDFNMGSLYMLLGFPMFFGGIGFGFYRWIIGATQNIENSAGTVMLAVLPIILGVQFLLQAIGIDIDNVPKKCDCK